MKLLVLGALLFCSTSSTLMDNKKTHVAKDHSSSHKLSTIPRMGPTSNLKTRAEERIVNKDWLPSVKALSVLIDENPILRMNWQSGIAQCKKKLFGKTGDQVLDMVDAACKKPPAYSKDILVGFPINTIFIQFMQNENGRAFFSDERVNLALQKILNDFGAFLQTPESRKYLVADNEQGWFSPEANKQIHNQQYKCDPSKQYWGYGSWNDWFLREFKPGMRQIGEGTPKGIKEENVIVNACESAPIVYPTMPQFNVQLKDQFWLKQDSYSLSDMFGSKKLQKNWAKQFEGGTVYQAFLSALFYHRWHSPVDGTIEDIYLVPGAYYLDQSQFIQYDDGSPNKSQTFISAVQARMVIVIKATNPKIGKIGIIFIGMAEVSSCVGTVKIGQQVKKGEQLGYFMFGGSTHAMVFQKKAKLTFKKNGLYFWNPEIEGNDSIKQNLHSYLAHVE